MLRPLTPLESWGYLLHKMAGFDASPLRNEIEQKLLRQSDLRQQCQMDRRLGPRDPSDLRQCFRQRNRRLGPRLSLDQRLPNQRELFQQLQVPGRESTPPTFQSKRRCFSNSWAACCWKQREML